MIFHKFFGNIEFNGGFPPLARRMYKYEVLPAVGGENCKKKTFLFRYVAVFSRY